MARHTQKVVIIVGIIYHIHIKMDEKIQESIDKIRDNLKIIDKNLLVGWLNNLDRRITNLEGKSNYTRSIYHLLNLIIQFAEVIAILVLAYFISKLA